MELSYIKFHEPTPTLHKESNWISLSSIISVRANITNTGHLILFESSKISHAGRILDFNGCSSLQNQDFNPELFEHLVEITSDFFFFFFCQSELREYWMLSGVKVFK